MERFAVPRHFFVTSGVAQEGASELNAFDLALRDAGIAQCNLVEVSSILPPGCTEVEREDIPPGSITFCVMARMTGTQGDQVGCGLAWAWGSTASGERYGMVAEHHGKGPEDEIERMLRVKLERMAEVRGMQLEEPKTRVRSVVCEGRFGCVVAVLVFTQ